MARELRIYNTDEDVTLYAQIRSKATGNVWNGSAFDTYAAEEVATYALPLSDQGGGLYVRDFPTSITAGHYDALYYLQAGASPTTNDQLLKLDDVKWTGSAADGYPPAVVDGQVMDKLTLIEPPATYPVSVEDAWAHARIGTPQVTTDYTQLLIAAATEYAENAMQCSLVPRTYMGTYFNGEPIILRRGPLVSVLSVSNAAGTYTTSYDIEHVGHKHLIKLTGSLSYPIRVLYVAGYEPVSRIPASIKLGILQHVATLNEHRESISDKAMLPVPQSLKDFYRLHSRGLGAA